MYSTCVIINTQISLLNLFTYFFIQVGYYQDEKEKISFFSGMAVIYTYNNNRSKLSQMILKKGGLSGTGKLRIDVYDLSLISA